MFQAHTALFHHTSRPAGVQAANFVLGRDLLLRDLARRLHDPLHQGRESFRRRFPDLGDEGLTLLHEAFVQVLAAGDQSLLPGSA